MISTIFRIIHNQCRAVPPNRAGRPRPALAAIGAECRPLTVAQFDQLVEPDESGYELDEGQLVVMTKPRPLHNRIVLRLTLELQKYLELQPAGEVFNPENLFVLGPNTKRAPDVPFLKADRAAQIDPNADIPGAPDLAVEVISPTDTVTATRRKIRQYLAAGASLV